VFSKRSPSLTNFGGIASTYFGRALVRSIG
jgi:hypothetical protein